MGPGVVIPVRLPSWLPPPGTLIGGRAIAGLTPRRIVDILPRVTMVNGTQAPFIRERDGRFVKDRVVPQTPTVVGRMAIQAGVHYGTIISHLFLNRVGYFSVRKVFFPCVFNTLARW